MKTGWMALWMGIVGMAAATAETYHRLALRELDFADGQKGLEEALERQVRGLVIGALRFPAEAYVAAMPVEGGERQWMWKQGDLEVVFRLEDGLRREGWVDLLRESDDEPQGFAFSVEPAAAKSCSLEEFEAVKMAHYKRLRDGSMPGKAWFRHQVGEEGPESGSGWRDRDLERTFGIFSGGRAISENLALDRELIVGPEEDVDRVALKDIQGVTVKAIDWKDRLPDGEVAVDPLSLAIPSDQHAMFCSSLGGLLELVRIVENEGAPMVQTYTVRNPFRTLISTYRAQMGLDLPDMAARLLPVKSVAVTGGDPFFPLGTDVAVLFETDQPEFLYQALLKGIEMRARTHKAEMTSAEGAGYEQRGYQSADRSFSSHVLRRGDLVVVSNSAAQLKRLIGVGDKLPALGAGEEYQYFRHRYPLDGGESAFLFLSDETIRRWAGPELRIGASRRTRALAALAEQASRVVAGEDPGDEFKGLLGDLKVDGRQVTSAAYGSPHFLTPVAELGIESATKAESEAYERWRRGYEQGWSQVFDPIALRIAVSADRRDFDLTVLPLTVGSDYQEMMELTGGSELSAMARTVPPESLMHFAMALDPKSRMFSQFDQELPGMLPGLKVNPLGWVGESLSIDLEQGFFWKALAEVGMDTDMLMKLPVVLRLESKSQLKLAAFLTGVRAAIESSAPDLVKWELRKHGEKSYVLIRGNEEDMPDEFVLCYYASSKALLISLDEDVLMRAMDRELAGADEAAAVPLGQARQVLMETRPDFMLDMGSMIEDVGMDERRQQESWKALPILNEWHRRFPNEDPVEFHQTVFGEDLFCPGGKGYRWNSEDLTIESVAYGHPAGPRNEGMPQPWIKKFGTLRAGLEFAEGGLRARLMAGPGRDPKPAAGASKRGPVLATAAELTPQKVGTIVRYRTTGPDGVETLSRTVSKVEETGEFIRIENESVHEVEGEKSHSKEIMRLGNDGVRYLETSDEESRTVYDLPEVDLPAELVAGADTTHPFSGTIIYQGEDSDEDRCFGEYRIRIIGLEAVEVPAGKYDSCIRMESVWMGVSGGYYSDLKYVGWYAKGVGLVKYETRSGGERQVTEMVEYSEGGGP